MPSVQHRLFATIQRPARQCLTSPDRKKPRPPAFGLVGLVGLLIVPSVAQAHVRWFVDPNSPEVATFDPSLYSTPLY